MTKDKRQEQDGNEGDEEDQKDAILDCRYDVVQPMPFAFWRHKALLFGRRGCPSSLLGGSLGVKPLSCCIDPLIKAFQSNMLSSFYWHL